MVRWFSMFCGVVRCLGDFVNFWIVLGNFGCFYELLSGFQWFWLFLTVLDGLE